MKQAQAAWAALSGLFVICGTIVITDDQFSHDGFAFTCLVVGIIGWLALTIMLLWDARQ